MKKVLVTQTIPEEAVRLLGEKAQVIVSPSPDDRVVRQHIRGCHAILVRSATRLSAETINCADLLEVISRTGTGIDNIDVGAATNRGVMVCNTPDANTISVAEHALACILWIAKDLSRLDRETRAGNWAVRDTSDAMDVSGRILGLVGLGRIGRELGRLALAVGMQVIGFDPHLAEVCSQPEIRVFDGLDAVLETADVVSLHAPLTEETRRLLDARSLSKMKHHAILINTSRGGLIDQEALVQCLRERKIRAAALDVFDNEPIGADDPLCRLSNVLLTPHSAALTKECKVRVAVQAVTAIIDVLEGRMPKNLVNRDARAKGA